MDLLSLGQAIQRSTPHSKGADRPEDAASESFDGVILPTERERESEREKEKVSTAQTLARICLVAREALAPFPAHLRQETLLVVQQFPSCF